MCEVRVQCKNKEQRLALPLWHALAGRKRTRSGFSVPWEIADRSKIVLLSIDGHFDPRKMPSGRGFGKNMKIEWKIDAKIEGFWWLRTTFGVILFAYFTLSAFSKQAEKSMPKWSPKVVVFGPKCDLWRPRVDWFYNFCRFLKIRKIVDFSMSL